MVASAGLTNVKSRLVSSLLAAGVAVVAGVLVLQVVRTGMPDPLAHRDFGARVLDIAVLVFREGLECILVLAAVTANLMGARQAYQRPVAAGAVAAFVATLATWFVHRMVPPGEVASSAGLKSPA